MITIFPSDKEVAVCPFRAIWSSLVDGWLSRKSVRRDARKGCRAPLVELKPLLGAAIESGLCPRKNPLNEDADELGKLIIAIRATRIINAASRLCVRRTIGVDVDFRELGIQNERVKRTFSG